MNFLGKSLIFLIMVMSVFFMAASVMVFATHTNWKEKYDSLSQDLTRARQQQNDLTEQREQLERQLAMERAARTQMIARLESEYQTMSEQLNLANAGLTEAMATSQKQADAAEAAAEQVTAQQQQLDTQKAMIVSLQESQREKFERVMAVTDENHQLAGMLDRVQDQNRGLREQLGVAEGVLGFHGLELTTPVSNVAPRNARGVVRSVRGDRVVVSLGSDDGIRVGHELDIHRGGRYLGRIRITKTDIDESVGNVLDGFQRGVIQRNDSVRTR